MVLKSLSRCFSASLIRASVTPIPRLTSLLTLSPSLAICGITPRALLEALRKAV